MSDQPVILGHQKHEAVSDVDKPRLLTQYAKLVKFMEDGAWRTLFEIAAVTDVPHGSVGSQLRNMRVDGYVVEKRRRVAEGGTWEYRVGKKCAVSANVNDTSMTVKQSEQ